MRICVLADSIPPEGTGGAERVAWELARVCQARGHETLVVTTVRTTAHAGESVQEGVRVIRIHSDYHGRWRAWRALSNPQIMPTLRRILAEFRPDIVHAHNIHAHLSYAALAVARRTGARVFLTAHDAMLYAYGKVRDARRASTLQQLIDERLRYNPFRTVCIRRALQNVERIIAVSDALASALRTNVPTRVGAKIDVIHNGIDAAAWTCDAGEVSAFKARFAVGERSILFGGRLSGPKGGGALLAAMPFILRHVSDAQLVVMGDKNVYAELMLAHAEREGSASHVIFTGHLTGEELRAAYHAAAVVCVPSLYLDPFPTVNLEAMACAKPVVATTLGGSREAVEDGVTGIIANPENPRALAGALVAFLQDPALAYEYGTAGYARVLERFSLAWQAGAYLRLFETV